MTATPYLTAAAARLRDTRLADLSDDVIEYWVADFEDLAERYRRVAFTPRDATATLHGNTGSYLFLPKPHVSAVTSITIDDTALSVSELADVTIWGDEGTLERSAGWYGTQIVVVYTHGYTTPPATILDACTEYVLCMVRSRASGVSRNTTSQATDVGTTRFTKIDWEGGTPTGWSDVDRLLNSRDIERVTLN